jgi:(heptosyl)LPS beta-1,4-glucosyltransferase
MNNNVGNICSEKSQDKIKISVYLIAKNEEKKIRTALESVKWADEIVVVDSGSIDKTKEIALEYGAKVFDEEFRGFVFQKNSAMEHCSGEWLFNIDADEEVTDDLRKSIEFIIFRNEDEKSFISYNVNRKIFYLGRWMKHCGWYPEYRVRLSRKGAAKWVGEVLHEKLEGNGKSGYLKGDLLHRPYDNLGAHLNTIGRYTGIWAARENEKGRKVSLIDLIFRPAIRFFKMFVLKAGFLDGVPGFTASFMGGFYAFMKYARLYEMNRERIEKI